MPRMFTAIFEGNAPVPWPRLRDQSRSNVRRPENKRPCPIPLFPATHRSNRASVCFRSRKIRRAVDSWRDDWRELRQPSLGSYQTMETSLQPGGRPVKAGDSSATVQSRLKNKNRSHAPTLRVGAIAPLSANKPPPPAERTLAQAARRSARKWTLAEAAPRASVSSRRFVRAVGAVSRAERDTEASTRKRERDVPPQCETCRPQIGPAPAPRRLPNCPALVHVADVAWRILPRRR